MHYHQNPYVRNITGLHRNYEHKRQIKRQADLSLRWEHSHIVGLNFYFICTIQTQLQSNTVIIEYKHYTNGIQKKVGSHIVGLS